MSDSTVTIGNVMVIDLTEAFGAGNEPDKAWCDENIPFFPGTHELTLSAAGNDTGSSDAPLYQLTQGTFTSNGVTVTVSGNRVTLNGQANSANLMLKLSNGFGVASTIAANIPASWKAQTVCSVGSSNTHSLQMKNITGAINISSTLGLPRAYFDDGLRVSAASSNPYTQAFTPAEQAVPSGVSRIAFISVALGADGAAHPVFNNYSFDLETYLSGKRVV